MHVHLFAKEITLDGVLALDVDQVFSPRVDIEVAVFSANGALAVHDFETFERGEFEFVFNGCTMAVCFVPDFWGS